MKFIIDKDRLCKNGSVEEFPRHNSIILQWYCPERNRVMLTLCTYLPVWQVWQVTDYVMKDEMTV